MVSNSTTIQAEVASPNSTFGRCHVGILRLLSIRITRGIRKMNHQLTRMESSCVSNSALNVPMFVQLDLMCWLFVITKSSLRSRRFNLFVITSVIGIFSLMNVVRDLRRQRDRVQWIWHKSLSGY